MYLKQLESWEYYDWEMFFFELWIKDKEEVKTILTRNEKKNIEADFSRLWELINGVGPSWFTQKMRNIVTWFFPYIRFEWHDINFALGGGFKEFYRANWGLLKYSFISIFKGWFNDVVMSPISIAIILVFYIFVMTFWIFSFRWVSS